MGYKKLDLPSVYSLQPLPKLFIPSSTFCTQPNGEYMTWTFYEDREMVTRIKEDGEDSSWPMNKTVSKERPTDISCTQVLVGTAINAKI